MSQKKRPLLVSLAESMAGQSSRLSTTMDSMIWLHPSIISPQKIYFGAKKQPINTAYTQKMIGGDLHGMAAGDYDNDTFG